MRAGIHLADISLLHRLRTRPGSLWYCAADSLSRLAEYHRLLIIECGLLYLADGAAGRRAARLGAVSVLLTTSIVDVVLKPIVPRERPTPVLRRGVLLVFDAWPSGHTANAVAFSTAAGFVRPQRRTLLYGVAAAIGWSRVALGAHYPSDVVGGAAVGALVAYTVWLASPPASSQFLGRPELPVAGV